uniref:Phospholipase A2 n=1 Tax=Liphistius thaleban TaxID=1905330 RepID=A0A4Q8K4X2_9ARAC
MNWLMLILQSLLCGLVTTAPRIDTRMKRDLLNLADKYADVTGLDPTDYIPYGNWCGYGGQGQAVDKIDSCCKVHDLCYGLVSEKDCRNVQLHIVPYEWRNENRTIVCDSNQPACERKACLCDKEVVACISENNDVYKNEHRYVRYSER